MLDGLILCSNNEKTRLAHLGVFWGSKQSRQIQLGLDRNANFSKPPVPTQTYTKSNWMIPRSFAGGLELWS